MKRRLAIVTLLVELALPGIAYANQGILVLAHHGTAEWNAQVKELTAKVNAQKPAEIAFGTPTRSALAAAVDRLSKGAPLKSWRCRSSSRLPWLLRI